MGPYMQMKLQAMGRTSRGHPSRWVVSQASLKYIVLGGTIRGLDGEIPWCSHCPVVDRLRRLQSRLIRIMRAPNTVYLSLVSTERLRRIWPLYCPMGADAI